MTVSVTFIKVSYNGDDATVTFPITFPFDSASEIEVLLRDENASPATETVQTSPTEYSVSGTDVVMVTAPATGEKLIIRRATTQTQATDYIETADFPAESHENALDKLTRIVQELEEASTRSAKLPKTSTIDPTLPEPEELKFLRWQSGGTGLENATDITTADLATQAEAEGGTDNVVYMSPLRVQQWLAVQDTDDLSEGAANFYYTEARFDSSFTGKDTDDLSEGVTNLYYTDVRADARIAAADVGDLANVDESGKAVTNVLAWDGVNWSPAVAAGSGGTTNPSQLDNLGLNTSVAASALTIGIRQSDGSTAPTAGNPVTVAFRSSTEGLGSFSTVNIESSIDVTIPSGAVMGHRDGTNEYLYVYVLNNAGTAEVAVSSKFYDEGSIVTTSTIGAGSDDNDIYSTTGRGSVAIRLVGRLLSNQTTAGTWDANVSQISLATKELLTQPKELLSATSATLTPAGNGFQTLTGNSIELGAGSWRIITKVRFSNSGTPTYTEMQAVISTVNGANTPPTLDSGTNDAGFRFTSGNSDLYVMSLGVCTLTTTTPLTIFIVPFITAGTPGDGRITGYIDAERIVE